MVVAGTSVTYIKDTLSFLMGEALMQGGVSSPLIKNISNDKVTRVLVVNALEIILREMRRKCMGEQVRKDVLVPWIIHSDA